MKVALIPARGGSKRIPRKNIRPFDGQPMIAYSIRAALATGVFDRIIVSTDDEEIAAVARSYGAETPFVRPPELSGDFVATNDVVRHAILWLRDTGCDVQYLCSLYPTAPFVTPEHLREGLAKLVASDKSFAFSVTAYGFPLQRAIRINSDGAVEACHPEHFLTRSQDLEPRYHDAGQFYWGRAQAFVDGVVMFSPAALPVILPRFLVQDIDTEEDWERAELMHRAYVAQRPVSR